MLSPGALSCKTCLQVLFLTKRTVRIFFSDSPFLIQSPRHSLRRSMIGITMIPTIRMPIRMIPSLFPAWVAGARVGLGLVGAGVGVIVEVRFWMGRRVRVGFIRRGVGVVVCGREVAVTVVVWEVLPVVGVMV